MNPDIDLDEHDLVLCAGTLRNTPLLGRVQPAVAAGFRGLSVFSTDITSAASDGISIRDLRDRITGAGLAIAEVDPLANWFPSAIGGKGLLGTSEGDMFEIAEGLSARPITAVVFAASPPSQNELVECYAGLCGRAAERGLQVHLEFIPFTPVRTLQDALVIVEGAGCKNGGIMLDAWHLCRSGGSANDIEAAAKRILGVQLDDASETPEDNLVEETMHRRLLPGEGIAGVPQIISALRKGGSTAPLGVEVFSDTLMALAPGEVTQRAAEAVRRCIKMSL